MSWWCKHNWVYPVVVKRNYDNGIISYQGQVICEKCRKTKKSTEYVSEDFARVWLCKYVPSILKEEK